MTQQRGISRRDSETVYQGFLQIDRETLVDDAGTEAQREVIVHPGSVGVLAIHDGEAVFIRQYRAPVESELLEIPAGILDVAGESMAAAVARECREEIGLDPVAGSLHHLVRLFPTPGYSKETIDVFVTEELVPVPARPHALEEVAAEIVRMPWESAVAMARDGEFEDAKTIVAVLTWAARRA